MTRLSSFFFFAGLVFVLAACTSSNGISPAGGLPRDAAEMEALSRAAIVTTGSPRLDVAKPSTISWLASLDVVGKHQTLSVDEVRQHLTNVINNQIMAKGYPLVSDDGDFQLEAVVVLADSEDENTLLRASGGMDPGLAGIPESPGKGTLVMELKQGRVTRWKGTVQIYIAPQFDQAIAWRRIEYAVAQLLGTWP